MKTFNGVTLEEAVKKASEELGVVNEDFHYIIKNGAKEDPNNVNYVIDAYVIDDVVEYAINYLTNALKTIEIDVEITSSVAENHSIRLTINSERNPILIGKNGRTLRALNELVKVAVSNKFKRKFYILLDVGNYKDKKYSLIISIARRVAKEVNRQHIDIKLDPMTNDERKVVHEVLQDFHDIKTESYGEGEKRAVVVKYIGNEEHAFQQSEIYYKDIIHSGNKFHNKHKKHFRNHNESSLDNLLHNPNSDFLKNENDVNVEAKNEPIAEENKVNKVDNSIDDLPSASIVSPLLNKDALKDFEEDNTEKKDEEEKK